HRQWRVGGVNLRPGRRQQRLGYPVGDVGAEMDVQLHDFSYCWVARNKSISSSRAHVCLIALWSLLNLGAPLYARSSRVASSTAAGCPCCCVVARVLIAAS